MANLYTYETPAFKITVVQPGAGPTAGGTAIEIFGSGFVAGLAVTIGGSAATSVVVVSDTKVTAVTPAHAAGLVDVTVSKTGVTTATLVSGFTYQDTTPDVAGWFPAVGGGAGTIGSVRRESIRINQTMGQAATCQLSSDLEPAGEQGIRIDAFGVNLFHGTVTRVGKAYEDQLSNLVYPVSGLDLTWQMRREYPDNFSWNDIAASTVFSNVLSTFAPSFTAVIEGGLKKISLILDGTTPLDVLLTKICGLCTANWVLLDTTVYVFTVTATGVTQPGNVTDANQDLLHDIAGVPSKVEYDYTQIRNVILVTGANGKKLPPLEHAGSIALYGRRKFPIKDNNLATDEAMRARAQNELDNWALPYPTLTYSTRDIQTAAGKTVTVNLLTPAVSGTFVIRQVTIDQIDEATGLKPRFSVTATPPNVPMRATPESAFGAAMQQVIAVANKSDQQPKLTGDVVSDPGGAAVIPENSVTATQLAGCIPSTKLTNTVTPVTKPSAPHHLVGYTVDAAGRLTATSEDATKVVMTDGSEAFSGDQSMGGHKITSVTDPAAPQDAATKAYVDAHTPTGVIFANGSVAFTADESMGNHKLTNVTDPTNPQDAATKAYVDSHGGPETIGETPGGLVNGSNTHYTTAASYPTGTLRVYRNGLRLVGADFTETGAATFDINVAPETGDLIRIDYGGTAATQINADNLTSGHVPAARMPALTGDVTSTIGTVATTLAASGVAAATYGDATHVPQVTVDAKGRITAASNVAISASALVLLEEHTAAASATLDFTTWYSSAYDEYLIELINVIPATNAQPLWMRVSTDGGATYDAGANYSYGQFAWTAAATALAGATGATKIILTISNISNSASWGVTGQVRLYSPGDTTLFKQIDGVLHVLDSGSTRAKNEVFGAYESATAINALRFLYASGNITSGTIRIYGVAK